MAALNPQAESLSYSSRSTNDLSGATFSLRSLAIVQGWAEPHYLGSVGLMPAGTVVVYTPKNREELAICYSLFFAVYHSAFPRKNDQAAIASLEMSSKSSVSA